MEPLVHYSQQDPLYNGPSLTETHNNLKASDDLSRDHSELNNVYGHPPIHHVIERPVYIKEPEPIIEIIIRESNVTLPPLPTYPVTVPPRKKEQVQVFYVKYKKNPGGYGKDDVIYDKPIPALTPHVPEEHTYEEPPVTYPSAILPTLPPPPSTTLRAIIKPDSESYHADKGIHITFGGKLENDQYKRSHDGLKEGSETSQNVLKPQEKPQSRQFTSFDNNYFPPNFPNQNFHSNFPPTKPERFPSTKSERFPPISFDQPQFGKHFNHPPGPHSHGNSGPPPNFNQQSFSFPKPINRPPPPQFSDSPHVPYNQPIHTRQPVSYQPFETFRQQNNNFPPQSPPFQFPRPHTHFPVPQRLPEEQRHIQATQQQFQNNIRNEEFIRQQHANFNNPQQKPEPNQFQHFSQQLPHQQLAQQFHNIIPQQQFSHHPPPQINTQTERGIPPGGELIPSLNKFEQHISVPVNPNQSQNKEPQQSQSITNQQYLNSNQQQQQYKSVNQNANTLSPTNQQFVNNYQQQQQQQLQKPQQQHFSISLDPSQNKELQQSKPVVNQQYTIQQPQYQIQSSNDIQHNQELLRQHIANQQIQLQLKSKQQQSFAQNVNNQNQFTFVSPSSPSSPRPTIATSPQPIIVQVSSTPEPTTKSANDLNIELPDEVPEDLRQQLLSSGILQNAQISVLDYDKVGDIPLSALPPDQLANFYNAGGGQQIAAASSEQSSSVVRKDGKSIDKKTNDEDLEMEAEESETKEIKMEAPLEMKVVRYNPETEQGQKVKNSYVQEGAKQTDPVALNDQQYNKYLPVKVNGATFPIPNVPELVGRNITSVVILAPVDYNFNENSRSTRDVQNSKKKDPRHNARVALKKLIDAPSAERYEEWLEKENTTVADKQAVVLLVTGIQPTSNEKEIFMYDIATKTVNKLSGELSSAFVDAAETNSKQNIEKVTALSSDVVETIVPYPNREGLSKFQESDDDLLISASEYIDSKIPIIDPTQNDNFSSASEQLEKFVDISGMPIHSKDDLQVAASNEEALTNQVSISSGYSKTGSNLLTH